jgi:hypothetical protein
MSSHSSDVSIGHLDQDDLSCGSYSSGWERSSTSDDWDSSSGSEYEDDDNLAATVVHAERFQQPKSTGKPTLFDMEYKCELLVLPNPYQKNTNTAQKKTLLPAEKAEDDDIQGKPEETVPIPAIQNPWKPMDAASPSEDPWKFLNEMHKPVDADKERPAREPRREERRRTHSRPIDNSNTNKLCKYKGECRMNKNNNCNMVHDLSAWKPRICRFNNSCKRKNQCGYYHTDMRLADYLKNMIKVADSIYAKNSALYEKYL